MNQELFQKEDQHSNGPVTVLGKTFANDVERRAYFREELRKKLPELKEIEGFPIGEDEDIINLSDPPFYTACPNPWINDFIAEWEEEKKQLEKEGKRIPDFEVTEPYAADVSEGRNNPIYMAHSYHTKVPHPAIMRYIMHYTQPGDVVFDGFAGTGMTGVAASMCQNGVRKSICSDLSPIASLITANYNLKFDFIKFKIKANKILEEVQNELGYLYEINENDKIGQIHYFIWSDVLNCGSCGEEVILWNGIANEDGSILKNEFNCPKCGNICNKKNLDNSFKTTYDSILNETVSTIKKNIVRVNYSIGKNRVERDVTQDDIEIFDKIQGLKVNNYLSLRMPEGDESRRNDKTGIMYTHQFFTFRNILIIDRIYEKVKDNIILLAWLTSGIQNISKMWKFKPDRKGGTLAGTLYIPSLNLEQNPFEVLNRKISSFVKTDYPTRGNSICSVNSATNLSLIENNTIDYIFTDPPFGANLMYSELSFIWESIIKVRTNNKSEAITNKFQNKTNIEYKSLMLLSLIEYYRILKPGKWMTVEFSNTSAAVWNGIQTAITSAGFVIANVAALDKKQGSFKAVNTVTAVKQDLVISCYKPSSEFDTKFQQSQHSPMGVWDFVEEHLSHLPIHLVKDNATTAVVERSAKILFDRLIAFYVQRSLPVPIDAGKFQEGLKERFVERDGMYFTQEQVEEYERKKAEVPEFIQMSLFVGSEQDAVYWLRQLLEKEPKTEQDLHPLWMREVAGNMRKGDSLPEMRQILEENFLKDDTGKWYVPDAENEADLEKLRNKRLLKIFEDYKTEAAKPKGKLKEVRVEALRVGFKQCYQDKDFKTIVTIGDRIPNNLLMEDEVLLQFYDIAAAKI